ncbi:MAG: efflux RND transporter permease subunit [Rickettsiales bacterium]
MNLSVFCIQRPVFTTLLMAAIVVGGIMGYRSLAVSALPNVDFPTIQVTATLPGASPETMASSVASPLERQFSTIAGVSSMTSTSFLGNTQITLQFDLDRSIDGAALDVQTAISTATPRLPKEMLTPPSFRKVNPADQPILFIAVSSDTLPLNQVNDYADTLMSQRISTLPGVAQVSIFGSQKYAVRLQVDPAKLAALGMSITDMKAAVSDAASVAPVGIISGDKQLFNIEVKGQPQDAAGFATLIARWVDGAPVRLSDIGKVTDGVEVSKSIGFLNGTQSIVLAIQRQPDANTIDVVKRVRDLLPVFRDQIPASVTLTPLFDRSVSIKDSVHDVQFTLFITIALVILVIFGFLRDIRATLIPAFAVPLSIVATYGVMALLGFSINNVSLLALTLCVGFVVDDAIVMLENIVRYIEEGMNPLEAALKGSREIGFTIISITLSLIAVFIPVLFMGGLIGRLFSEFAITISVAILASGLVSLTLTPMLCSKWLKGQHQHKQSRTGVKLEASFNWMATRYEKSLRWALLHRRMMLLVTLLSLFASIGAFIIAPKGFFPLEDVGFVFASTEAAQDISYEAMVEKQKRVAEIIRADPAVSNVFYAVGGGRGALNSGRIFFGLKPRSERESIFKVIQRLRKSVTAVEGINTFMQPIQNIQLGGRQSKSLYQYTLQGTDLPELYAWSDKLLTAMQADKKFQDVTSDLQVKSLQATVVVDQQKAASLGISYNDIRQALYAAFGESQVASLYKPSNDYAVILEVAPEFQKTPEDIGRLYVRSTSNPDRIVPLDAIATVSRGLAALSINHQGQLPAVTISYNVSPGVPLGNATDALAKLQDSLKMPTTITPSAQGNAAAFAASASGQGALLLTALLVIYIILGMLYESFIHPITILSGLPSAGLGAVITLMIFGMDLSIIAMVGIILLVGIVKKNAIMMIDFAIVARNEGATAEDAIYRACTLRFRPIMMTTLTAIFGTLPIALGLGAGAELRQPLGIAIVGGLLTSQLLTLYITPVVYLYLDKLSSRRKPVTAPSL